MLNEYDWKVEVTGLISDGFDTEEEALDMYKEYKARCGDASVYLSYKGTIIRQYIPAVT
jgi:hypothetical protein